MLTYTQVNQEEMRRRLAESGPLEANVSVVGWFSFLMAHWVRPYLPRLFAGRNLRGFNFDGDPGIFAVGQARFLDAGGRAYKLHLAQLAMDVNTASVDAVLDRLSRIYDAIYIDEVQDLNGYDLEIVDALIASGITLTMVGDVRQALLLTNPREKKNKQYRGVEIKKWFDARAKSGQLIVTQEARTWRANQKIADFGDSIFDASWGFLPTKSENKTMTGHDGVFIVASSDVLAYVSEFQPLCLRHSASTAKGIELPFMNIGIAKGMGVERVLIWPTLGVLDFLRKGKALDPTPCCSLYVAVTRAQASVVFVVERPQQFSLPVWKPN